MSNGSRNKESDIKIESSTIGIVSDMGIKDANNMGAAMAPAALDTLICHLKDTGRAPSYYDAIITGDLGYIGKDIEDAITFLKEKAVEFDQEVR